MRLETKKRLDYVLGGAAIGLLRPMAYLLGSVLQRNHGPAPRGDVAVIKLLGGGSLVLAGPSLLGLRLRYPGARLVLVTTPAVKPFGEMLGLFDAYVVIDDRGPWSLAATTATAMARLVGVDTVLDLEPYSRSSTVLGTLTGARNRLGFYLESTFWREHLATHLVFFNRTAPVQVLYDAMIEVLDANAAPREAMARRVAEVLGVEAVAPPVAGRVTKATRPHLLCLAPACSDLGRERMLSPAQWKRVLERCLPPEVQEVAVLGTTADQELAEELVRGGSREWPDIVWTNACDGRALSQSLALLASSGYFIGIDSALLHFAHLFGVPSRTLWGPTDPATRLKTSSDGWDRAYYVKVPCSPCIHVAEVPPCGGKNACIEAAVRGTEDPEAAVRYAATVPIPVVFLSRTVRPERP